MAKLYKKCDEIPLFRFVEVYKGDLLSLVIEGEASEKELRDTANLLIEEYSVIVGNKNVTFEIDRQSKMINYNIRLILLDVAEGLLRSCETSKALEVLKTLGIRANKNDPNLSIIRRSIESTRSETKLRIEMLKRQLADKPKGEADFVKERMIVSSHFKMYIDPKVYTAAEYGHLIKLMLDELKEMRYGK